jgi:hypothetical protein
MGEAMPNPFPEGESEIEIRQVFEAEDFGAEFTPELREQRAARRGAGSGERTTVILVATHLTLVERHP